MDFKLPAALAIAGSLSLLSPVLAAPPAAPVKDLNTTRTGSTNQFIIFRTNFVSLGSGVLFQVDDGRNGMELWRSDGSAAGTTLVRDICPGACSSNPALLTVAGSQVFFTADDGSHGRELWKSDGTAAGTQLVADLAPGLTASNPFNLLALGGKVLFAAHNTPTGSGEPWVSDGTAAGTTVLADIEPGPAPSDPAPLGTIGAVALFSAGTTAEGRELWRTDGTPAGTVPVANVNPGNASFLPRTDPPFPRSRYAVVSGGRLFFAADDGTHGMELWVSDGTAPGTSLLADIQPGGPTTSSTPDSLVPFGTGVLFRADDGAHGSELWTSDGTTAGTHILLDINPGSGGSGPADFTVAGSRTYFRANDGVHGAEFWVTDGTAAGTTLLADLNPSSSLEFNLPPAGVVGSSFLFYADDGVHGSELWKTDGTGAGTALLADINAGAGSSYFFNGPNDGESLVTVGGRFYFVAYTDADGFEVWTSDGTAAGTQKLKEINDQTSAFLPTFLGVLLGPRPFADLGGSLLFGADDGSARFELRQSNGTAAGTQPVSDGTPGTVALSPLALTPLGAKVLFSAEDAVHSSALWRTDGTAAGTGIVKDLDPADPSSSGDPHWLTPLGSKILFAGPAGAIWSSDGTPAGTQPLGATVTLANAPVPFGGVLLFSGSSASGAELWRTDGTLGGTSQVLDVAPGAASGFPYSLTVAGGVAYFSASTAATGRELWKTDGTPAGTALVKDLQPGAAGSLDFTYANDDVDLGFSWAALGGELIFQADDGVSGQELWQSDGTAPGTLPLADILPGALGGEPRWITAAAGRVFFTADDGVRGRELWTTDGTPAGTGLLADIEPGAGSSLPMELRAVGRVLLFSAWDATHGRELWISDGTPAGTSLLQDIAPDALSSSPMGMFAAGPRVYFTANDNSTGFELWSLPKTALGAALAATKTASGFLYEGGTVTYRILVTNHGATLQPDAAGHELIDVLPAGLALIGATATAGTVAADTGTRTVTWDGSLAAGDSATVTITATIQPGTLGTTLANQATLAWDADADGLNDATGVSDDPGAAGTTDPTPITVGPEKLGFYTIVPCRVADTRNTAPLTSGATRTFNIAGTCGIPSTARAVAANLTVVGATGAGVLVVWKSGTAMPGTSNLNFKVGSVRGNNAILSLGAGAVDAQATVGGSGGSGTLQLILDVSGYFQ